MSRLTLVPLPEGMSPWCPEHRWTMARDEQCAWWVCPPTSNRMPHVLTDEAVDRGERTPVPADRIAP